FFPGFFIFVKARTIWDMQEAIRWPSTYGTTNIDIDAIKRILTPEQAEDVDSIMLRFRTGKGRMVTNSTGTGKTFVALGTMARFLNNGKGNILVVTPTDNKCKDWIMEAQKHF